MESLLVGPREKFDELAFLDAQTVFPVDEKPRWREIRSLAKRTRLMELSPDSSTEEILKAIGKADAVFNNKVILSEELIEAIAHQVRLIAIAAVGVNVVQNIELANAHGIMVLNAPEYAKHTVSEWVIGQILYHARRFDLYHDAVVGGQWHRSGNFTYLANDPHLLYGRNIAIHGFGRIGKQIARVALALGMNVCAYDIAPQAFESFELLDHSHFTAATGFGQNEVKPADYLVLQSTYKNGDPPLVDRRLLSWMRKTAVIINAGRAGMMDFSLILQRIREGKLGALITDVLPTEAPNAGTQAQVKNSIRDLPEGSVIYSPHAAWSAVEARVGLLHELYDGANRALRRHKVSNFVGSVDKIRLVGSKVEIV